MTLQAVVVDVLLAVAVLVVMASAIGVLVMRDTYQKVHYVTPAAVLAPVLVGLAILAQSGWSYDSSATWLALLFVLIAGPYLSHATIRAARIREQGDWRSGPAERSGERGGAAGTGRD